MAELNPPAPLDVPQSEWLLEPGVAHLNHGSFGAVPRRVLAEHVRWIERLESSPVHWIARQSARLIDEAKHVVGPLLGMSPRQFGFMTNATEGVNAVLRSVGLRAGDQILTTTHIYNACRVACRREAHAVGATLVEAPLPLPVRDDDAVLAALEAGWTDRTKLVLADHCTSPTAVVFPVERLAKLCRERGVALLVDGAHAPGMLPLDVTQLGATYYVGNLHKWVCGPKGCAFLWAQEDRVATTHGHLTSHAYGQGLVAELDWPGTRDFAAWLAVPEAIRFWEEVGWDRMRLHNAQLAAWARQLLEQRLGLQAAGPPDARVFMAALRLPRAWPRRGDVSTATARLYDRRRVEIPHTELGDEWLIRPCAQVYNRPEEYERLCDALLHESALA